MHENYARDQYLKFYLLIRSRVREMAVTLDSKRTVEVFSIASMYNANFVM